MQVPVEMLVQVHGHSLWQRYSNPGPRLQTGRNDASEGLSTTCCCRCRRCSAGRSGRAGSVRHIGCRHPICPFFRCQGIHPGAQPSRGMGHSGIVLRCGHLIPDQANYLCHGVCSHVEIAPRALAKWQRSRSLSPPPMQQILSGGRARDRNMATS